MKNINPKGIREEYISLQQAAEIYGCTQKNMALMARRGKIKAMKIGNHWVTTKKWLDDYADSVKDVGRPEKPKSYKLEINLFKSKQGKIFKKYLTTTFVIALTFLSLVSFYSAAKPRVAPAVNLIVGKVEKFVSLNSRNINEFPSQAIIETNKVIASVFGVDSNNKINKTSETIVRRIVSGYKKTVRDINNFFKNIFLGIDKFLDNCGKFVINATCDTINSTIHTFTNTKELTDKIAKKIPFFSIIPSPIGDFVVSVPTTIAKVANNLIASFKSFFPFYLTLDGSGNQTLISIRDLYKKIKELRELIEGKAILVNQITQQITVVKPETIVPVSGTTPIDISAQLAVFKNEILSQIAEDITNVQSKIGQTLVTQNNYYYSEAVESSRIDVVNNDITFNEQVAMKKNLSVDGNLTVLGTTTFSGGVLMTGVAINDLIINNLLNASHASVSDDLTASIAEITDLTSTNLLTNSLIFATASGSNAEITSAGFDNLRAITITDNILLINSGNIINGQNFSFVGASISDWLTIGDSVSIVNSLTSTNIFGTHASISDDLEILSANIASASIGTLYNAIFDTTNLIATHTSVSDDLTIGDDVSFVDGIASISGATNIYGVLTLYGNLIGVRASLSDSLTVTDTVKAGIITDGTATLTGGTFTELNNLTSTNIFGTHVSVSDDLSVVNNIHVSSGILDIDGTASSTFAGDLDIEGDVNIAKDLMVSGIASFGTTQLSQLTVTGQTDLQGNVLDSTGTLTLADDVEISGITQINNTLNVDSGVFYVDSALNRVGINTTNLDEAFEVVGNASVSGNLILGGIQQTSGATSSSFAGVVDFAGVPIGTNVEEGSVYINPTTAGVNNTLLGIAVGDTQKLRFDAEGDLQISGIITATGTGTSQLSGNLQIDGNTILGSDSSDTITVNGQFNSNLIPSANATYSLGSADLRWASIYVQTMSVESMDVSGTSKSSFIINTGNDTADEQDSQLEWERGTASPNAILKWNSTLDRFEFNDFTVYLANVLTVAGTATSSFAGQVEFTGAPVGSGINDGSIYINPSSGAANYTLFGIAVADSPRFSVDAEGDTLIQGSLGVENQIYDITQDTLTINDDLQINGNDIKDSGETIRITLGDITTITATTTSLTGDLKIGGNDIQASDGTTAITLSNNDVTIADSLTAVSLFGTHTSISDDFETLSAQITSASIGTLYNTTFDAINLFVTHASVSDDLSVVNNIHISSGVIDVDGLASSSFAGDLDVEGDVNFGGNDFYVDASTGRVGIGTTTPNTWLDIAALTNAEINLRSTDAFLSAGDIIGKIGFYKTDDSLGGSGIPVYIQARAYDEGGLFDLDFITGSVATPVTAMTIDYLGNVGIGTTSPDAKLDVAGQIISSSSWTKHASVSDDFETLSAQITSASIGTLYNTTFDATNLFAIHASISDDFETLSAQITSASLGSLTVSGTATSSFAGPISVNDKIVASRLGYFGKYNSAEVQGIWSIGGAFDVDTANNNFGNQYGMGYAYNQVGGSPFANEHQIVFTNNGTINAAIGLSGSGYFAGNVGIGTTSPDAKLDVAGQIISSSSWTKHASVSDDFETLSAQITSASLGSLTVSGTATSSFAGPVNIVGDLDVQSGKLFVDQSSGNVGIGTTNPKYKLSVDGTASISGILYTDTNVNIGGNLDVAGGNITSFNAAVSDANATLPHIVLDSTGSGDNWADQGAYISLGEGGDLGSAATHLTYRGDGYGYVGAGTVVDGEPAGGYWRFKYNSEDVYTDGSVQIADNLQVDGGTITLGIDTNFVLPGGINGVSFNTDTLSIDAANNRVGIGTTAPGAKLQITSDGAGSGQEQFVITGLIDPNKKLRLGYDTVGNFGRIQALTSGTSYDNLVLNADGGNVGIGDTNPGYTLSVDGTASISGNLNLGNGADNTVLSLYSAGGTYDTRIQWYGSDGLSDYYVGLTSDGGDFNIYNYMYNAYALIIDSATNNIAIGPDFSPDAGLEITASGSIGYLAVSSDEAGANNGDVFIVDANKNVGIASASPDETLSVDGNINFTGKLLEDGNEMFSGVIAMFDTDCPVGWTRFTALDNRFARGAASYGGTGGSSTIAVTVDPPKTTTSEIQPSWEVGNTGGWDAVDTHSHTVDIAPFESTATDSLPPYLDMVYCKKDAGADVAEWTSSKEQYEPGTLVVLDPDANERVMISNKPYDSTVAGIISTQPGWTVGTQTGDSLMLALTGRVPAKVSLINGSIKIGDPITTSAIPGTGMKATQSGAIVGKAMSNFDDNSTSEDCVDPLTSATFKCGEIVVFVNLSWYGGEVVEKIDNIFNMNNTSQETMVLSIDDLGVLNIDATTSISQDLYVGNKLYVDGMDVKDEIEKLKLAINSQGTIGTIIETSNPILPTSELMASVIQGFKDLGIEIYNGIIKVAQIVVKTLVVEKNSDQTQSSIGEGTIKAEETSVIIESNQVLPTSKIFVTFRSDYGSRWWIGYQEKGRFTVNIADPLSENVKFDWWIVQTEQVEIVETATETPVEVPTDVPSTPIEEPVASSSEKIPTEPAESPVEIPVEIPEEIPTEPAESPVEIPTTPTEEPSATI